MKSPMKVPMLVLSAMIAILFATMIPSSFAITSNTSPIFFSGPMIPSSSQPVSPNVVTGVSQFYSANWAGYAYNGTKDTITKAQGSWIQPAVTCTPGKNDSQVAAFWVGIDGLTSKTVEQTGTLAYCPQGSSTASYYAWYEFYPAQPAKFVSKVTVNPGDKFEGIISFNSTSSKFTVTLKDLTTGIHFTKSNPAGFTGKRSSAECIAEDPAGGNSAADGLYYLANFGTVQFGQDYTAAKNTCSVTVNGKIHAIGSLGARTDELTMVNYYVPTIIMAQPSTLSTDKKSFTAIWESLGY